MSYAPASFAHLLVQLQGPVAVVTLNRPEALNALNRALLNELDACFKELEQAAEVRAVILTGSGAKAFAAGADISELATLGYEDAVTFSTFGQRLFNYIENFPKPVLAAVNGFALGGGCELAMACHLRVASANAKFGQPEVNLGIIAGYGGTQRLPRLIGKTKGLELLLTGAPIGADEALTLGLVNYVVPQDELMNKCTELLALILQKAPLALSYTLDAVNAAFDYRRNGYETEAVNFGKAVATEDAREGTAAFLEKRKPAFQGK